MTADRVAVIGAGPAGLTVAYALARAGVGVDVYESSPHVGGLTRSFELWGSTVDLGPHIFGIGSPEVMSVWNELIRDDWFALVRNTKVLANGRLYDYPLRAREVLRGLDPLGLVCVAIGILLGPLLQVRRERSAKSLFIGRFGSPLYRDFFLPYCRKLWGTDPSLIDEAFALAMVGDITVLGTLRKLLASAGRDRADQLRGEFPYARRGAGAFSVEAARYVEAHGGKVFLNTGVSHIYAAASRVTGLQVGDQHRPYRWVVSSMPLSRLVSSLGLDTSDLRARIERLRFRSTVLVYLNTSLSRRLPYLWSYINDAAGVGRITNVGAWTDRPSPYGRTILTMEYWCTLGDELWKAGDDSLRAIATQDLAAILPQGTLNSVHEASVVRLPNTHPFPYCGYQADLDVVMAQLQAMAGLSVIGRAGMHRYDSQYAAVETGLDIARQVQQALRVQATGAGRGAPA